MSGPETPQSVDDRPLGGAFATLAAWHLRMHEF